MNGNESIENLPLCQETAALEELARKEEELARTRGGHHAPLARMIRLALTRDPPSPRQQLCLFPASTRPRVVR